MLEKLCSYAAHSVIRLVRGGPVGCEFQVCVVLKLCLETPLAWPCGGQWCQEHLAMLGPFCSHSWGVAPAWAHATAPSHSDTSVAGCLGCFVLLFTHPSQPRLAHTLASRGLLRPPQLHFSETGWGLNPVKSDPSRSLSQSLIHSTTNY